MIHLLHHSLVEHFASLLPPPPSELSSHHPSMLHITNQYFEAHVLLDNVTSNFKVSEVIDGDKVDSNSASEDGLALVFFSHGGSSAEEISKPFDSLSRHHQNAECNRQCGDLIRLCIGITDHDLMDVVSSECEEEYVKTKEEEFTRRVLWCLDHGYEYVEADLTTFGRSIGHDERDKEGFARIVEAVGSTVWSTAKMHPRTARQLRSAYDADKSITSSTYDTKSSESVPLKNEEYKNKTLDTQIPNCASRTTESNVVLSKDSGDTEVPCPIQSDSRSQQKNDDESHSKLESLLRDTNKIEDEVKLESLEFLIKEASRIRESAKQGELSDDERRQQAGDMALKLISMLGDDLFGSDSDDEANEKETNSA